MIIEEVNDDILKVANNIIDKGNKVVVLHGCNCFHTMGSGIAIYLRIKYPEIFVADLNTLMGDKTKLGKFSSAKINDNLTIVNCYTQFHYGKNKVHADSTAIFNSVRKVCESFPEHYIVMPKIGCGLGGGKWSKIKQIVNNALKEREAIVCYI